MATSSSPDSSVSISSLLASCSLGSSSRSARATASIQYKDRLYDSASKALEDYIVDYEAASTGKITVRPSTTPTRRAHPSVRHRPSLNRSRSVARDPDLLSLTTDDLLGFPPDGSLPFTQASEQKRRKNLKKQYGSFLSRTDLTSSTASSSLKRTNLSALDLREHRLRSQDLQRRNDRCQMDYLLQDNERENDSGLVNNSSLLHRSYPRWLTSQKSELGVSGITSIPDVKYPVWLRDHRLLGDIDGHIDITRILHRDDHATKISSSLGSLEFSQIPQYEQQGYKVVNSGNIIENRKRSDLGIMEHLHRPRINHCVQKSEHAGGVAHKDLSRKLLPQNQSPRTEDILEAERSWENLPFSYKPPVHVPCEDEEDKGPFKSNLVEDFLKDCVQQVNPTSTFSGGNHHGPVEALKHILFNLQAFQQNFDQDACSAHVKEFKKISTEAESEIQRMDQEIFPVNKSLQKALQHLSRLKDLVGDCDLKKKEDSKPDLQT